MKKIKTLGVGFARVNFGIINDSYSEVKIKSKQAIGFCERNVAEIKNCFVNGNLKTSKDDNKEYGFSRVVGDSQDVFYINSKAEDKEETESQDRSKENNLPEDYKFGIKKSDLYDFLLENKAYSEEYWEYDKNKPIPRFNEETYFVDVEEELGEDVIHISTKDDLIDFAEKVNNGEWTKKNAVLDNDINLKGTKWIPIGKDETVAYEGVFDGGGYCVLNTVFHKKTKCENNAFFGVVKKAHIVNLHLEFRAKKLDYVAGFVYNNKESLIECCGCSVRFIGCKNVFAFVNQNNGTISRCYVVGQARPALLLWLWLVLAAILFAALIAWNMLNDIQQTYPGVPVDAWAGSNDLVMDSTGENSVGIEVKRIVRADTGDGIATFAFDSPNGTNINQYTVVNLQVFESDVVKVLGKSGRLPEEQEKLNNMQGYDPSTARIAVAQSGAVYPGQSLTQLQLNPLPDGSVLPSGQYNAVLLFQFYEVDTNEKSTIDTQIPIYLRIGMSDEE